MSDDEMAISAQPSIQMPITPRPITAGEKSMNASTIRQLPTIDESAFYRLLEEAGTVRIDIAQIGRYFVPQVSFFAKGAVQAISYGAIVRSRMDMLATESAADMLALLEDLAGECSSVKVNFVTEYPRSA
jgi:hypothetical protein